MAVERKHIQCRHSLLTPPAPFPFRSRKPMNIAGIFSASPFLFVLLALLTSSPVGRAEATENMTPLLLAVQDAPIPFMGSDGQTHLVYELGMTNFSSAEIAVEKVEVISEGAT